MKTLIFLIAFICASFAVQAQFEKTFSHTAYNSDGVITNTEVDTSAVTLSTNYHHVTIQPIVTKSANTAAGTVILYYSTNGTTWHPAGDTLTLSNQTTNETIWELTTSARYFRIITGGATTVTMAVAAKIAATP